MPRRGTGRISLNLSGFFVTIIRQVLETFTHAYDCPIKFDHAQVAEGDSKYKLGRGFESQMIVRTILHSCMLAHTTFAF